jgi:hypothetical protein
LSNAMPISVGCPIFSDHEAGGEVP